MKKDLGKGMGKGTGKWGALSCERAFRD